jgi:3-hydroxymyristoyl/3-hydroxydecanoyl-(acyl carrier protein) dehydratase
MATDQRQEAVTGSQHVLEFDREAILGILPQGPKAMYLESAVVYNRRFVCAVMDLRPLEEVIAHHFDVAKGTDVQEAMEQAGGVAALLLAGTGLLTLVTGADNLRWKRQVRLGDRPIIRAELDDRSGSPTRGRGRGVVTVDGEVACSGEFTYILHKAVPPTPQIATPAVTSAVGSAGVPGLIYRVPAGDPGDPDGRHGIYTS